ncbi:MAG: MoaD/ThiS family protein [Candidatus Aminicenantes bacterium]|nr:MoaD/ThiS family protein [Candidatus Aminicenantes bacterium]
MKIRVKLIGPLMYEAGFSEKDLDLPEGAKAEALLERLALSKQRPKIITRNGRAVIPQDVLEDGDRIAISPLYSGG